MQLDEYLVILKEQSDNQRNEYNSLVKEYKDIKMSFGYHIAIHPKTVKETLDRLKEYDVKAFTVMLMLMREWTLDLDRLYFLAEDLKIQDTTSDGDSE